MTAEIARPIIEEIESPAQALELFKTLKRYPYGFFLDSATDDERLGRYSFLGCDPFLVFRSKGDAVTLEWRGGKVERFTGVNPFDVLGKLYARFASFSGKGPFPLTSGGVGYFAYDMKDHVEKLPSRALDDLALPDCILGFYDVVIIYDNQKKRSYIASSGLPETDLKKRRGKALDRMEEFRAIVGPPSQSICNRQGASAGKRAAELKSNFSRSAYMAVIEKAKGYIAKGDIYQVNLSQRFETELSMDPFELYERLRRSNPAPFASYLDFRDTIVLSSSPERFLLKDGRHIETRPIKGTRPRGKDAAADRALADELAANPKERAEHVMIVDLERNDLGKICEYGSVAPTEFFAVEKYATVHHLVSTVSGTARELVRPIDCLRATFPGGSITGAPKIRSMEIIEELEPVKRSVYTGAIGYIDFSGDMDSAIAIRTLVVKDNKVYFHAGGGIVADSDPEAEYEETLHKAKGMMRALGVEEAKEAFAAARF